MRNGCSSQEEHVLKRPLCSAQSANISCSSQEEHVLKLEKSEKKYTLIRCSSQEEHVLKQQAGKLIRELIALLLARGACIETSF